VDISKFDRESPIVVEPLRLDGVLRGVMVRSGDERIFVRDEELDGESLTQLDGFTWAVWDVRRVFNIMDPRTNFVDVKTLTGGGNVSLIDRAREMLGADSIAELLEAEQRFAANNRAIKMTGTTGSTIETMPGHFWDRLLELRCATILELAKRAPPDTLDSWWRRLEFIRALHEVEQAGIRVDIDHVRASLERQLDPGTMGCLRSMLNLEENGFLTSLFNAAGTRTGRLKHEGGFNAMGIPHGEARRAIISRHEGGSIYSFDYNAIDYRSIVSTIGGAFAELYRGSSDFHTRTAQFVFDEVDDVRREAFKAISYTHIYGGSIGTLVERTGLGEDILERVLKRLEGPLSPIAELRERIWSMFQRDGYIDIPGGGRYERQDGEEMHPGKALAIYAQGYSAYVFENAFLRVHGLLEDHGRGSCIIFPVHDELVVDMHPDDERELVPEAIKAAMETGEGEDFVVNYRKGRSYGELV